MKTLKSIIVSLMIGTASVPMFGWGQKGHDVTAYIAEQHLTPATKAAVDSILDGKSLVYWANWLDNASHQPEMRHTKTWHYKNIDEGLRYEEAPANPAGDAVTAIKAQVEALSNKNLPKVDRSLALIILTHVAGDLHQPMHIGHATDLGGNRVKVNYFGRENNLHSVWDSSIPESARKWSYTEWQQQIDRLTPQQQVEVVKGSVDDWAKETMAIATAVYKTMPSGANLSYNEVAYWTPVVEEQFLRGGLRLAHLLNSIFDPGYNK